MNEIIRERANEHIAERDATTRAVTYLTDGLDEEKVVRLIEAYPEPDKGRKYRIALSKVHCPERVLLVEKIVRQQRDLNPDATPEALMKWWDEPRKIPDLGKMSALEVLDEHISAVPYLEQFLVESDNQ